MEKKATSKRYPPELKERAVRMVKELRQQDPGDKAVISRVARQLGVGDESLRSWVKQSEIDGGARVGLSTAEQAELKELRKEVNHLRRSNDILQAAAAFMSNPRLCAAGPGPEVFSLLKRGEGR
jgi:transposase